MNTLENKLFIAKMLPEKIEVFDHERGQFRWINKTDTCFCLVVETEWLHIMHLAEEKLEKENGFKSVKNLWRDYICQLMQELNPGVKLWDNEKWVGSWSHAVNPAFATFNQRATAMRKVKETQ